MSRALAAAALALCVAGFVVYLRQRRRARAFGKRSPADKPNGATPWRLAEVLHVLALTALTASVVLRSVQTGRPPFATTQEFASTFAWGIMAIGLAFAFKRDRSIRLVCALSLGMAALLLGWVVIDYPQARNLTPALQNNPLFISHVGMAVAAYGAFAVAFGAAVGRLFMRSRGSVESAPGTELMDSICYRAVRIGFPLFTMTLLLGSVWADVAWGSFWSWDPKETASLLTWLVFAAYLHSRLLRGWTGKRPALIVIIGFVAVVATFLGNFFFSGLHSYN